MIIAVSSLQSDYNNKWMKVEVDVLIVGFAFAFRKCHP